MNDLSFHSKNITFDQAELRQQLQLESNKIIDMLIRKRADYGPFNIKRFGEQGIVIRVSDKIDRLINLITAGREPEVADETTDDTWRDIAGYALLALIARKG